MYIFLASGLRPVMSAISGLPEMTKHDIKQGNTQQWRSVWEFSYKALLGLLLVAAACAVALVLKLVMMQTTYIAGCTVCLQPAFCTRHSNCCLPLGQRADWTILLGSCTGARSSGS